MLAPDATPVGTVIVLHGLGADGRDFVPIIQEVDLRAIERPTSPLSFRACFTTNATQNGFALYPNAKPLVAPGWFDCFDAAAIGAALASSARAMVSAMRASPLSWFQLPRSG